MRAIILAAGRGSRMGALTDDRPKCLTLLGKRSLLERAIESLKGGGCTSIGIVTGYRANLVAPYAERLFNNDAWAQTNMVSSLRAAEEWLVDEPTIVSYSDIFFSSETIAELIGATGEIAMAYDPDWHWLWRQRFVEPLLDAETFRVDCNGDVLEIGARPKSTSEVEGQYMGLLKITPAGWKNIRLAIGTLSAERRDHLDMTGLLSLLLKRGARISAVKREGPWGECDSASDILLYQGWIAEGRLSV